MIIEIINKASYEYYVLDNPTITDQEYDDYYNELVNIENKYPEIKRVDSPTNRVGGEVLEKFEKEVFRYSLENVSKTIFSLNEKQQSVCNKVLECKENKRYIL